MKYVTEELILQKLEELHAKLEDNHITLEDAIHAVQLLGLAPSKKNIEELQDMKSSDDNFSLKELTQWATQLSQTQPSSDMIRQKLLRLFERFDPKETGFIKYKALKALLMNVGEPFTEEEINACCIMKATKSLDLVHYPSLIERLVMDL